MCASALATDRQRNTRAVELLGARVGKVRKHKASQATAVVRLLVFVLCAGTGPQLTPLVDGVHHFISFPNFGLTYLMVRNLDRASCFSDEGGGGAEVPWGSPSYLSQL